MDRSTTGSQRRPFLTAAKVLLYAALLGLIALAVAVAVAVASLPSYSQLSKRADLGQMIRVHAANGTVIVSLGPSFGKWLTYSEIPPEMRSAMIAMTRSMSRELGPHGVTVHLFWPGAVETEIDRPSVSGSMFDDLAARQALPRPATMDDFAGAVLFLCSDDAEYLTGQALVANGGLAFP